MTRKDNGSPFSAGKWTPFLQLSSTEKLPAAMLSTPEPSNVHISIACPFCSIPFRKTPLLLACGHSLCENCIGHFRWQLKWKSPNCPICLEPTTTLLKNYVLDEVVEKLWKENRNTKQVHPLDDDNATEILKKELREIIKRNDDLEVEIVTWHELHDLKQKEISDFRTNNPDDVLNFGSFIHFCLTILFFIFIFFYFFGSPFK